MSSPPGNSGLPAPSRSSHPPIRRAQSLRIAWAAPIPMSAGLAQRPDTRRSRDTGKTDSGRKSGAAPAGTPATMLLQITATSGWRAIWRRWPCTQSPAGTQSSSIVSIHGVGVARRPALRALETPTPRPAHDANARPGVEREVVDVALVDDHRLEAPLGLALERIQHAMHPLRAVARADHDGDVDHRATLPDRRRAALQARLRTRTREPVDEAATRRGPVLTPVLWGVSADSVRHLPYVA